MKRALAVVAILVLAPHAFAQPKSDDRFERTEAMVPMRDGVKLHTRCIVPKDAKEPLPIILIRTPYGIDGRAGAELPRATSRSWPTTATSSRSRTSAAGTSPRASS